MKKAKKAVKGKPHAKPIKDDQLKNVAGGTLINNQLNTPIKLDTSFGTIKLNTDATLKYIK